MRTTPPLRWDPKWPASRPITEHPDFDLSRVNDPEELALFIEFGPPPMGGSSGITGALAYHPRFMLTPRGETHHAVLADFIADAVAAERDGRIGKLSAQVARVAARLLMQYSQVLRLVDVARLAGCTRLIAHRELWTLAEQGLLVFVDLDPRFHPTHVMFVHDGTVRLSSLFDRGEGWEMEMDAEIAAEEAAQEAEERQ